MMEMSPADTTARAADDISDNAMTPLLHARNPTDAMHRFKESPHKMLVCDAPPDETVCLRPALER